MLPKALYGLSIGGLRAIDTRIDFVSKLDKSMSNDQEIFYFTILYLLVASIHIDNVTWSFFYSRPDDEQ